jgi:death on curing protein
VDDIHEGICRLDKAAARGVKSKGIVESCINYVFMEVYGIGRFPGVMKKAAGLLRSFAGPFHPYIDANKRTAILLTQVFLLVNGYNFHYPSRENTLKFLVSIAEGRIYDIEEISKWLEGSSLKNTLFTLDEETRLKYFQNLPLGEMFELTLELERKLNGSSNSRV